MYKKKIMTFILALLTLFNSFILPIYAEETDTEIESISYNELVEVNDQLGILTDEEISLFEDIIYDNLEVFESFEDTFPRKHRLEILKMVIEEMGKMSPSLRKLGLTSGMGKSMLVDFIRDSIYDTSNIKTTEIDYTISSDKDYRILFLFDLQLENLLQTPKELQDRIKEENPDILILGGDIVNSEGDIDVLEDYLGDLNIEYKYYVRGNHEYYLSSSDLAKMEDILEGMGFVDINNDNVSHKGFNIIGVDDSNSKKDDVQKAYEDLEENELNIVVTHNHDINYELDKHSLSADIVVSGHTHGGQINSFLVPQRKNSNLWKEKGFYYGEYTFKGKNETYRNYTANGLGGSRVPLRLGAQQEFLVINIFSNGAYDDEKLPESIDAPVIDKVKKDGLYNVGIKNKPKNTILVFALDGENWNSDDFNLELFPDGEYKIHFKYISDDPENYIESDVTIFEIYNQNNLVKTLKDKLDVEANKKVISSNYQELKDFSTEINEEILEVLDEYQRNFLKEILSTLKNKIDNYEESLKAPSNDYDDDYERERERESRRRDREKERDKEEAEKVQIETIKKEVKEEVKMPEPLLPDLFIDIEDSIYKKEINVLASKGIIKGVGNGAFQPNSKLTRAEFVQMLVSGLNLKSEIHRRFNDINEADWYYNAVSIASGLGLVQGVGNDRFEPNKEISREEIMVILKRTADILELTFDSQNAPAFHLLAENDISPWASDSLLYMKQIDVLKDELAFTNAKEAPNRDETVHYIYNLLINSKTI